MHDVETAFPLEGIFATFRVFFFLVRLLAGAIGYCLYFVWALGVPVVDEHLLG